MHNIILLGMPGVGKTTIGRLLATFLDKPFLDTDEYIIAKTGQDPAEHFGGLTDIEALAREIEFISDLEQTNGVIGLSGSVPMTDAGMNLVRKWGDIIIQLEAPVSTITKRIAQRPDTDSRIIFGHCKNIEELRDFRAGRFESLRTHAVSCDREPHHVLHAILEILGKNSETLLTSTRTDDISAPFREAIFEARPEKGLWYRDITSFHPTSEQREAWSTQALENPGKTMESLWNYLGTGFSELEVAKAVERLSHFRHPDILPFRGYNRDTTLLDLTQGPTCAFKDFALQMLTSFVAQDMRAHNDEAMTNPDLPKRYMIAQTSTSGDTGPAGGAGIAGQPAICNIIGYPEHEASYVQKQQMHALGHKKEQQGNIASLSRGDKIQERNWGVLNGESESTEANKGVSNVFSLGFEESFSSIQKSMMSQNTPDFQAKLHTLCAKAHPGREVKIHAGSFNSINPGRIDAQMIYHSVAQFRAAGNLLHPGQKLATVVPSGNGGHVFSALAARFLSGIPGPTIISCNENDFFEKLINQGVLELPGNNSAVHQPSVSMIIEYPNNMERLFRLAFGPTRTSEIMETFFRGERVELTTHEQSLLRFGLNIHAVRVTGTEELQTMRDFYEETGTLICPHTANALHAWNVIKHRFPDTHGLICETASPWKFLASAAAAVSGTDDLWQTYTDNRELESTYAGVQTLLEKIRSGYEKRGLPFTIPEYMAPWLGPEISHDPTYSCSQFGEKTLECVEKWLKQESQS